MTGCSVPELPTDGSARHRHKCAWDRATKMQVRGDFSAPSLQDIGGYVRTAPRGILTTHFPFSRPDHKVAPACSTAKATHGCRRAPRGVVPGWQVPRRW